MDTRAQVEFDETSERASASQPATLYAHRNLHKRPARVLTAEDNEDLRDVMRAVLESNGFRVTACADAEEAESVFSAEQNFDLLVTDLGMPGKSGAALAANLSSKNPSLPIMIVSGADVTAHQLQDFTEKGWAFVPKPFSVPNLLRRIESLLATSERPGRLQA